MLKWVNSYIEEKQDYWDNIDLVRTQEKYEAEKNTHNIRYRGSKILASLYLVAEQLYKHCYLSFCLYVCLSVCLSCNTFPMMSLTDTIMIQKENKIK